MKIQIFTFNNFAENTYILYDDTDDCVIVDPGNFSASEDQTLFNWISEQQLIPTKIINTHAHIEHILGIYACVQQYPSLKFYLHEKDAVTYNMQNQIGKMYGFGEVPLLNIDGWLQEGTAVRFGDTELQVLFTPGHAPGHVVFYHKPSKVIIGGDVLFRGGIGRTDLPGCNHEDLIDSIRNQLFVLPDDVVVYPGHGSNTTIGYEKTNNPFVGVDRN